MSRLEETLEDTLEEVKDAVKWIGKHLVPVAVAGYVGAKLGEAYARKNPETAPSGQHCIYYFQSVMQNLSLAPLESKSAEITELDRVKPYGGTLYDAMLFIWQPRSIDTLIKAEINGMDLVGEIPITQNLKGYGICIPILNNPHIQEWKKFTWTLTNVGENPYSQHSVEFKFWVW